MSTASHRKAEEFDVAMSMARQAIYRFLALSFLDPRAGSWEHLLGLRSSPLLQEASELVRRRHGAGTVTLARGERPIDELRPEAMLAKLPTAAHELNAQYEQTFGLLVSSNCPPYETEYIHSKLVYQRSNALADVAGFYHAFGVEPSRQRPDRHDHIVNELEFMAYLIGLERQAAEDRPADWRERQAVCHDAQRRFLAEHLSWWTPTFARLVGLRSPDRFYDAAAQLLAAWIPAERSLLGVAPTSTESITPSSIERPELCEGCALAM
jgi:TorA maturation chaperone TorD